MGDITKVLTEEGLQSWKKNISDGVTKVYERWTSKDWEAHREATSEGGKLAFSLRSKEDEARRCSAISEGLRKYHANKTEAQKLDFSNKMREAQVLCIKSINEKRKDSKYNEEWLKSNYFSGGGGASSAASSLWNNLSSEDKDLFLRSSFWSKEVLSKKGHSKTILELFLGSYLDYRFPNIWSYNGCRDSGITLNGKIPDFVRLDGIKEVAEAFGRYYHPESHEEEWKAHYSKLGYKCFIVWEEDCGILSDMDKIFGVSC